MATMPGLVTAQFTPEHAAMNNLRKGKWEKARAQLDKAIRKDSLNPTAHYYLAIYFFSNANPAFQIDSAYRYTMNAFSDFQSVTEKNRERLKKIPLDSIILVKQREQIDSAAFERAKIKNTEVGYIDFLSRFSLANQQAQAIELRNEVAFLDALKENTYGSYLKYLEKYPESTRSHEAKERYERLLYESKTKDKKLASYESFLTQYPTTPYRKEVEIQIFEIATASGEGAEFEKFIKKYPESAKINAARNILYHLLKDDERSMPRWLLTDSIQSLQDLENDYLVPFLKDGNFGFMNESGVEIIKPVIKELNDDYICGNITDEVLLTDNKVIARNGAVIYQGEIKDIEKLGYGFIKVNTPSCVKIVHYSGFSIGGSCYQNAKMIGANYLALQKDNRWSLWTLTGRMLTDFSWDDIQHAEGVVLFKKSEKIKMARLKDLAKPADQASIPFTAEYDDVKSWPKGMFWVRNGKEQGVLNQNLKDWIKPAAQEITSTFFGAISQTSIGYRIHDRTTAPSQNFFRVKVNQSWVVGQQEGVWRLVDPVTKQFQGPAFDSVAFSGPFLNGMKNDSLRIYLSKEKFVEFPQSFKTQFLPGSDSLFFLLVDETDKKVVFDANGQPLFTVTFDKVEYNNEGFFTVNKKDKRGLISLSGKLITQPEYDAIGRVNKGVVQVLKDKKFGLLDVLNHKEIKAEYDKNIVPYNATKVVASKNGLYGLLGWDNKPITPFEFEEVLYWNDSSAIVKKNFNWIIYNFIKKEILLDKIKNFKRVLDTEQEKILIIQQENKYGVISNRKGVIIPATFSDIINLGSPSVPLYFTEKHVEEAAIFVVIYYDEKGVQLRKQVYETDDYEQIYCSGN
jgi:hypothetical protein